ncbi:myosin-2 essential light chain-like [Xenia sp. Carnegie-2017]|uniref:myosin-2 essential light chain-like n=1 Tax=Xenia sp. Carnegie-2017 TaxID=2897299 RepID=UPI001F043A48|nr:myosin-2 essential light chain-like [Xenia sp. Carnegie-2017]
MGDLSDKELLLCKDVFSLYDTTGSEKIAISSLGEALRAMKTNPTEADIKKITKDFKGKEISFGEFLPVYSLMKQHQDQLGHKGTSDGVIECFRHFDRDLNGVVSSGELRNLLTTLGEKLTNEEFDNLTSGYINPKGEVSYEEFVRGVMEM